jgi:XTP/dITP diphosphohydrolase
MTSIARQIVLASLNPGKLREFNALFAPLGVEVISQHDLQIPAAPEPHPTFIENALAKARQASTLSGLPSLADDSGICVEALHGAPGIHSARFAGPNANDDQNNQHLLDL